MSQIGISIGGGYRIHDGWKWGGLIVVLTFLGFYPFIGHDFVFDDLINLEPLTHTNWSWGALERFISENRSGPTHRPIALFSFWLQQESWPHFGGHFKVVNVLIHATNGVFVFLLSRLFFGYGRFALENKKHADIAALFAALIWCFHPGNVSSVLYVVQRMNLLAVCFGLCGLYLSVRFLIVNTQGPGKFGVVLGLFGLLVSCSLFSKENGVLFIFLLPVCYFFLLDRHIYHRTICALTLSAVLLFFSFLIYSGGAILDGYQYRPFDLSERLMSQTHIWLTYLGWFVWPDYRQFPFFHDDYQLIQTPLDTRFLISLLVWSVLIGLTRWFALLGFTLSWFAVSHVLEGSLIPLELIFEHRNYLATIGLSIALVWFIFRITHRLKPIFLVASVILPLTFFWGANFLAVANMWKNLDSQLSFWLSLKPNSTRVKLVAAVQLGNQGRVQEAFAIYRDLHESSPDSLVGMMSILELRCVWRDTPFDINEFKSRALIANFEAGINNVLYTIIEKKEKKQCPAISLTEFWIVTQMLRDNPKLAPIRTNLNRLQARACLLAQDFGCYMKLLEAAYLAEGQLSDKQNLLLVYDAAHGSKKTNEYELKLDMALKNGERNVTISRDSSKE
ncbi:hypothetical protein OLMES_1930 [Oleiphilus messinensis]|uniref:Uncharacterized protein n=1 Tax=Oleiphilus messinensis TaxID=141451 RepID=A0A1Y0I997_9GAMM|nr:hypothetical protein [Oleiphilus messinensis]ARU56004.1 hypothetical protein OLMES_1930 [Oleiphilus messinensis]